MSSQQVQTDTARCYHLRFLPLLPDGSERAFPCDAAGHVDLDALADATRNDYYYARTLIGHEFAMPSVHAARMH